MASALADILPRYLYQWHLLTRHDGSCQTLPASCDVDEVQTYAQSLDVAYNKSTRNLNSD